MSGWLAVESMLKKQKNVPTHAPVRRLSFWRPTVSSIAATYWKVFV